MNQILLVNVRRKLPNEVRKSIHYVGRQSPAFKRSPLANPFKIGHDGDRNTVIGKYYHWLRAEYLKRSEVYNELQRLAELSKTETLLLGCWCWPLDCHAQVIRQAILGILVAQVKQQ